jgi:glyoxylase-like metal-dependent hydrolase (beta-lactamase superfamily II)
VSHRDALWKVVRSERVRAILVTHCHSDHSPLAAWLSAETGAPTIAVGPHGVVESPEGMFDGEEELGPVRKPVEDDASGDGEAEIKIEESIDTEFTPDVHCVDGEVVVDGAGLTMTAVPTPGHTSNHCAFSLREEGALFTGDHIMGWSTTVVSPPDGDMRAYMGSLRKVAGRGDRSLWPTHGPPRFDAETYVEALIAHRESRSAQIIDFINANGPSTVPEMVRVLYASVREELHRPAARSVLAHLIELVDDGRVHIADGGGPRISARFAR